MLLVEINPRDVVSVPSDSSFQKLRVSRYKVIEHIEGRQESNYYEFEDTAPVEDDGDFTEEGAVDEQETAGNVIGTATVNVVTEETKDEKPEETSIGTLTVGTVNGNSPVFGDPYTLKVDGSIDASKLEEKEEEKPSTLDKFKKWWTGE
jgi:hypothetical protein